MENCSCGPPTGCSNSMDMARIDGRRARDTDVWKVTNPDGEYHTFHVHDVQLEVLSVDGHETGPALSGWRDTV